MWMPRTMMSAAAALFLAVLLPLDSVAQSDTMPENAIRVRPGVSKGLLRTQVRPEYPEAAKQAHAQGVVSMLVHVDEEGNVVGVNVSAVQLRETTQPASHVTVAEAPVLLKDAAVAAVRQWKYRPYLLKGQPVPIVAEVEVNFSLER